MNPVDKYLQTKEASSEKKAGIGDFMGAVKQNFTGSLGGAMAQGAAGAATSAGLAAMAFGAKKLYDAVTKRRDFRTMLEHNPDLHEHLERDPKFFNRAYSSLRTVNPQFASEPLIAGNYMRQMLESPLTAGGKIELALQGTRFGGSPVLENAMKSVAGGAKDGLSPNPADPIAMGERQLKAHDINQKLQNVGRQQAFAFKG